MSRNVAASVRARLKNLISPRADFNLLTTRYGLERLLYRLSISPHGEAFLLKGALQFTLWYQDLQRPTRDADFLAVTPTDVSRLVAIFREVCGIDADDGVAFDPESVRGMELSIASKTGVVRITLVGDLARARIPIQIDIGHGDPVSPGPQSVVFPTLLDDLTSPRLLAYPKPTVIAEKLHAICSHGFTNTRMKDYFDLDVLLHDEDVDFEQLREAIDATFRNRGTPWPALPPVGLTFEFATDPVKVRLWTAFQRKNRMQEMPLAQVIARIVAALGRRSLL